MAPVRAPKTIKKRVGDSENENIIIYGLFIVKCHLRLFIAFAIDFLFFVVRFNRREADKMLKLGAKKVPN